MLEALTTPSSAMTIPAPHIPIQQSECSPLCTDIEIVILSKNWHPRLMLEDQVMFFSGAFWGVWLSFRKMLISNVHKQYCSDDMIWSVSSKWQSKRLYSKTMNPRNERMRNVRCKHQRHQPWPGYCYCQVQSGRTLPSIVAPKPVQT